MEKEHKLIRRYDEVDIKNRFLASAIHEIRTPIQTIVGTLELLDETSLNTEQTEYVRQIQFSADVLLSLVNDILDFSKIKSGKFNIENISYNAPCLVEKVVDLVSIDSHNRGLEIITDVDYNLIHPVIGDPTRIQQILLNLVKNAVKFTSKGYVKVILQHITNAELKQQDFFHIKGAGANSFQLEKLKAQNGWLLFQVVDSGIGITPEVQNRIFTDYYQGDASMSRKYGGTGLGLSISKNLAVLMHGYIGTKPNPAGGSIFAFALPYIESEDDLQNKFILPTECIPDSLKNSTSPTIPPDANILVVDDNCLSCSSLRKKLAFFNTQQIDEAYSGEQALEKMRKAALQGSPYSLVFIDMIMPKMDGWRLSAEINADRNINAARLYLIVPEGQMGGDAKMKMLDWFNGYLYKPIKRAMLEKLLTEAFEAPIDLEVVEPAEHSGTIDSGKTASNTALSENLQEIAPENKQTENIAIAAEPQFGINHTVIIAEDHPINQKILKIFLEKQGAIVFAASNGEEAVSAVEKHPEAELVFMDIQMPIMNGVDAATKIRENGFSGTIIACTANTDENDFNLYRHTGMNDILVKPFKKNDVAVLLSKWLNPLPLKA